MASGNEIRGFAQLMGEVKLDDTTTDQAAERVQQYAREEAQRLCAPILDLAIGLHPLALVHDVARELERNFDGAKDSLVLRIVKEYALLRCRLEDERARLMADSAAPRATLPPALKSAEQQLFEALRDIGKLQG